MSYLVIIRIESSNILPSERNQKQQHMKSQFAVVSIVHFK